MKSYLAACCAFLAPVSCFGTTMLFDFGNTNRQTAGWNNVVPATTVLTEVLDSDGVAVPGVSFEITDLFFQTGEPSQVGSENPTGEAAIYPADATDDYFFGHTGAFAGAEDNPYGEVKLSGLDPNKLYDFAFFSARNGVNDERDTRFTVTGANSGTVDAMTSNNDSQVVRISGIAPDGSNEITIGVEAAPSNTNGNSFFYINLMDVSVAVPEPTSAVLLLVGAAAALRRRA